MAKVEQAVFPSPNPPGASPAAATHRKPIVCDSVHYFDDTQNGAFSRMGTGPYAAIVTRLDLSGVSLFVIGPQGGRFDRENIVHKSQLSVDAKGEPITSRQKWWEWPQRA